MVLTALCQCLMRAARHTATYVSLFLPWHIKQYLRALCRSMSLHLSRIEIINAQRSNLEGSSDRQGSAYVARPVSAFEYQPPSAYNRKAFKDPRLHCTGAGNWGTAAAEADSADSQWPSLPSQPAAQPQQGSWGAAEPQQGNWAAVEPQQGSWGAAEPQQNSWAAAEPQQNSWAAAKPAVTKPQPAAAKPGDWGAIAEQTLGLAHLPAAEPGWGGVGAPQQQGHPEEQSGWGGNDHAGNAHRAQKPSRTNSQSWGAPERSDGAPERSGGAPERSGGAPERSGGAPERSGANGTATVVRAGDWAAAASDQPRANGWGAPNQPAQQPSVAESGGWGEASSLPTRAATSQQSWSEGRVLSICLAWKKH